MFEMLNSLIQVLVPFLIVLTILVFVHEFGHFIIARLCNVKIDIFSIGFGKELFGYTDRHGTRWKMSLIPLGGYVKMFGDKNIASMDDESIIRNLTDEQKKISFVCKPLWQKTAIVAAGPIFNYLLSIIILSYFFISFGFPVVSSKISDVLENSPAKIAGLKSGDRIDEVNGIKIDSFSDLTDLMSLNLGEPIKMKINSQENEIIINPEKFESKDQTGSVVTSYKIGIVGSEHKIEEVGVLKGTYLAVKECFKLSYITAKAMGQMISGKRSTDELGGPIKIAQHTAIAAKNGIFGMLWFIALLSINLGFLNLLPIPVLDGGHLLIFAIEAITNKKIAAQFQKYGFQIGFILLIMLTIFVTISDVKNLIINF